MSLNTCNCQCHQGTGGGITIDGCSLCWSWHQNIFPDNAFPQPDVTVTSNINEIKLDQIIQLLKDILEELKKKI